MWQFDFFYASYLGLVIFLISLITAFHILMNKHEESTSAVLWLFVVFSLPIIGLIIYLFFGINRLQTRGLRIKLANELINSERNSPIHRALATHLEEQQRFAMSPGTSDYPEFHKILDRLLPDTMPLSGNHVELLQDGTTAYPRMIEEIKKAESSIHLQSFIIMNDPIGDKILNALADKAREGVKVKVLYDKFGSFGTMFGFFFERFMRDLPNLQIRSFSQFNLRTPWRVQLRNHRKLIVIDGRTAFIGGINISRDNDSELSRKDRYIHDLHCLINGPAVGELQFSFLRDWYYVTRTIPSELFREEFFPLLDAAGETLVRVVASGPGQEYEATGKVFHSAVCAAEKSLWLMSPYFVPDRTFWSALCMAAARGIDVRIIVPEKNNHWYVHYASRSLFHNLLESGIRIYEKSGSFNHAKAMIIDEKWSYMGSSNCDVRSFRLNYELDFVANGGKFIFELGQQFRQEMSESRELQLPEINRESFHKRLLENTCSLFTPIL